MGADQPEDKLLTVISMRRCNSESKKVLPLLIAKHYYNAHRDSVGHPPDRTVHLIIDEAHNILSQQSAREHESWKDYRLELFEEIIKEGRKFGVFLTISSQRPADISPTIVSQLHNFFIHRLVNDRDLFLMDNTITTLDSLSQASFRAWRRAVELSLELLSTCPWSFRSTAWKKRSSRIAKVWIWRSCGVMSVSHPPPGDIKRLQFIGGEYNELPFFELVTLLHVGARHDVASCFGHILLLHPPTFRRQKIETQAHISSDATNSRLMRPQPMRRQERAGSPRHPASRKTMRTPQCRRDATL